MPKHAHFLRSVRSEYGGDVAKEVTQGIKQGGAPLEVLSTAVSRKRQSHPLVGQPFTSKTIPMKYDPKKHRKP